MTSSQHGLYVQGYTHATMASTMGELIREGEPIQESWSQFGLQAVICLHEAGVASKRALVMAR